MRKQTIKRLKKSLKQWKRCYWISVALCFALILNTLYFGFYMQFYRNNNVPIIFDEAGNFTFTEKEFIYEIISEVKPEYISTAKQIKIVRNLGEYGGYNWWGDITIEFLDSEEIMKMVICHELLHNVMNKFGTEDLVWDLGIVGVCYD